MNLMPDIRWVIAFTLIGSLVVGCSSNPPETSELVPHSSSRFDQLVSRDVVSVLQQVERLSPSKTTLGTSDASLQQGAFAKALTDELRAAGYAMRSVGAGPETLPVSYSLERSDAEGANAATQSTRTITVTMGDVAVRRTYISQADGEVVPTGLMQIRGVDASTITLNNDIFSTPSVNTQQSAPPAVTPPVPVVAEGEQLVESSQAPEIQPSSSQSVQVQPTDIQSAQIVEPQNIVESQNVQQPSAAILALAADNASLPLLNLIAPSVAAAEPQALGAIGLLVEDKTHNIRQLQQSNFESLFAEMGIVDEKILTFENDSTRMGGLNKARLNELLEGYKSESGDILSVIGCSLGPTAHVGGQEGLARGRAKRVREELLYAGVPDNKILAEGCWAEDTFDERMPRRGVVVTLKRPIS